MSSSSIAFTATSPPPFAMTRTLLRQTRGKKSWQGPRPSSRLLVPVGLSAPLRYTPTVVSSRRTGCFPKTTQQSLSRTAREFFLEARNSWDVASALARKFLRYWVGNQLQIFRIRDERILLSRELISNHDSPAMLSIGGQVRMVVVLDPPSRPPSTCRSPNAPSLSSHLPPSPLVAAFQPPPPHCRLI